MNKKSLFFLCLLAFVGVLAQGQGVAPYVIDEHLQPSRTGLVLYRSLEAALAGDASGAENFALQDGVWCFKSVAGAISPNDLARGAAIEQWAQVELPSVRLWSDKQGGVALYARDVVVPFEYMDKQLYLRVDGFVGGRLTLYINGERVGSATDSRAVSEWDITLQAKRGLNRVVLVVDQTTEASQIEALATGQGGVDRSVWLVAQPKIRVRDYLVRTSLDPTYENGLLEVALLLKTELLNPQTVTVYYDLYDRRGKLVNQAFRDVSLDMRVEEPVRFTASIPSVDKWTAETPSLYTVVFRVKREGRWTEVFARKVGFRTVEVKGKELLVNGVAPEIRGVNVLESEPQMMEAELVRLKRAGFNALRTSGGPFADSFYDQADSLGFYVWSVANAANRGKPQDHKPQDHKANTPAWRKVFEGRALANYQQTKNHPSVVAVALGEGAGNGYAMYHAYRAIKACDAERVVLYDGANAEWNTDVVCPLYPSVRQVESAAKSKIQQPIIPARVAYDPAYWNIDGVQGAFVGRSDQELPAIWAPVRWASAGKANLYRVENRLQQANLSYYPVWVRVKTLAGKEQWVAAAPIDCPAGQQVEYKLDIQGKALEVRIGQIFHTIL